MTTKQLIARIKKYYRLYGEQSLTGIDVPINDDLTGETVSLEKLGTDDGEIGVFCRNNSWFIPLEELVYKELSKVMKNIYVNLSKKK